MNRGVDGRRIFLDTRDHKMFLDYLEQAWERFSLEIYAFILMQNHFHLVLRTLQANLSRMMQWLESTYVGYFNRTHHHRGHLFQARFKGLVVESDEHLRTLSAYVHWNPVRASIVQHPGDYRWTSYGDYMRRHKVHRWVNRSLILGQLGRSLREQQSRYREWLYNVKGREREFWDDVRHGLLLGSEAFVEKIRSQFGIDEKREEDLPARRSVRRERMAERVVRAVAQEYGIEQKEVTRDLSRGRSKEVRDLAIYLLHQTSGMTNREIGKVFGIGASATSLAARRMRRALERNRGCRARVKLVRSLMDDYQGSSE